MTRLVIFGARGFAELAHYFFTHDSGYKVAAFTVDGTYLQETTFCGLPVVPFEEVTRVFPPSEHDMFVAMGMQKVNRQRAAKVAESGAQGYRLASFLSSRANVPADLELRPNTMIMEYASIHPFVHIGSDTVVWSQTRIAFHTRIGDHCWIVSALFGESVEVGDYSFIGLGATIAPSVRIGASNVIGAGALIVKNTQPDEVYRATASKASRVPSHRLWHI
jgi:sugar O-acyltransferase (sialic acid O-acetyltransferase NeuD family)